MSTELETQAGPSAAQDSPGRAETSHASSQTESSPHGRQYQCSASADNMASNLKDIRSFMLSAMESLDIPVPEDDSREIDLAHLKPKDSMYNEETVLDFWRGQLPLPERLEKLCDKALSVFTKDLLSEDGSFDPEILVHDRNSKALTLVWKPDAHLKVGNGTDVLALIRSRWPRSLGQQPSASDQEEQFMGLFHWDLRFAGSSAIWPQQFSYDKDGYLSGHWKGMYTTARAGDSFSFIARQRAIPTNCTCSWELQKFAAVWHFFLPDPVPVLSFRWLAFILSLLDLQDMSSSDWVGETPAIGFVKRFTGPWPSRKWGVSDWLSSESAQRNRNLIQYHLRIFSPRKEGEVGFSLGSLEGILCNRGQGNLPPLGTPIIEKRFSIALTTTSTQELPTFVLVALWDSFAHNIPQEGMREAWSKVDILPCLEGTGIAAFQFAIREHGLSWASEWNALLDLIDRALTAELGDVLTPLKRAGMMFDKDPFPTSELYFTILQLLRLASDWIRGSLEDLETLAESWDFYRYFTKLPAKRNGLQDPVTVNVTKVLKKNWKNVISHQKSLAKPLLDRIEKKTEEVKSLRDGLFNATAVREASRSSTLNHYILVFTVMTIIYLPLSFTAGLFALNLFKLEEPRQKTAFIVTIVLVASSTYFVSGYLVWFVRKEERRQMFRHLWNRPADGGAHGEAPEGSNTESRPKDGKSLFDTIRRAVSGSKRPQTSSENVDIPLENLP